MALMTEIEVRRPVFAIIIQILKTYHTVIGNCKQNLIS